MEDLQDNDEHSQNKSILSVKPIETAQPKVLKLEIEPIKNKGAIRRENNDTGEIAYKKLLEYDQKLKIEDLDDETAELIFKALDDVKELKEKIKEEKGIIKELTDEMRKSIDKEKEILTAKFESSKIFLQKYVESMQKVLEEELIRRNREKANVNIRLNSIDSKLEQILNDIKNHDYNIDTLSDVVACLVENCQMQQVIEMQDEIDRANLALMGYKDSGEDIKPITQKIKPQYIDTGNPYVTLDKQ